MATLNITEFRDLAFDSRGNPVPVGDLDTVLTSQNVTYTTSTQSATLDKRTRFVRVIADADCNIATGTNPTAAATDTRLEANVAEFFGVQPKGTTGTKIAAYDGTS